MPPDFETEREAQLNLQDVTTQKYDSHLVVLAIGAIRVPIQSTLQQHIIKPHRISAQLHFLFFAQQRNSFVSPDSPGQRCSPWISTASPRTQIRPIDLSEPHRTIICMQTDSPKPAVGPEIITAMSVNILDDPIPYDESFEASHRTGIHPRDIYVHHRTTLSTYLTEYA